MADVSILNVSAGSYDSLETSAIEASAATGTIPCENGKDNRMAVLVKNGDDEGIKFTVVAPTSGGGVRSSLGDLVVTIAAGYEALIPLFDTARFKKIVGEEKDTIDYELCGSDDGVLDGGELGNVTIVAMQL